MRNTAQKKLRSCSLCGKVKRLMDLFPKVATKVKPKPPPSERYQYCKRCWGVVCGG